MQRKQEQSRHKDGSRNAPGRFRSYPEPPAWSPGVDNHSGYDYQSPRQD